MKICLVSHSSGDAGAERALAEAVDVLLEAGMECLVVLPCDGTLARTVESQGAKYRIIPYRAWIGTRGVLKRYLKVVSNLWATLRLVLCLIRDPCDLVVTNTIAVPIGGLAAFLLRIPHVWWIHEFGREDHGLAFDLGDAFSTWFMGRTSAKLLVNSRAVASKYSSYIDQRKMCLLYYGVYFNFGEQCEPGLANNRSAIAKTQQPSFCIVGTLHEGKKQEDAVRALERLKRDGMNAILLVIGPSGSGSYERHLRELCRRLTVEDQVQFVGYVPDPLPVISSCDALVVCSRAEAFGRVTVEAMKLGKPVIGARSGGTVELVKDGLTGYLYTPGDCEELALRLKLLLSNAKLRNRMGQAARCWANQRFTRERFRDELVELLLGFLPDHKRFGEHASGASAR